MGPPHHFGSAFLVYFLVWKPKFTAIWQSLFFILFVGNHQNDFIDA